jgi:hypothetical protein
MSMVVHKARLYYLKNRYTILLSSVAFVLLTSLFLQIILLRQALDQSKDNENTLKGISCILLIRPEVRTQEKINACIDKNSGAKPGGRGFKFDPPDTSDTENEGTQVENKEPDNSNIIVLPAPISPQPPIVVEEESPPIINIPEPPKIPNPVPDIPIVKEIETRLSPITGELQCRVKGTLAWTQGSNCK